MGLLILRSSLTLSAHWEGGARARFHNAAAKKFVSSSEGAAEGGCGGNSAAPEQKIETSPAACSVRGRAKQNILFLLEERIRRAQIRKSEECFAWRRAVASGGGAVSFVGGFPKMGSDFVQGTEPNWMIRVLRLGASPLGELVSSNLAPRVGFEPTTNYLKDRYILSDRTAPAAGFEPATKGLTVLCSTAELRRSATIR